MRRPRRPWETLAAIVVLVLCLTGCGPGQEPLPTVSPAGPSTTVVLPRPSPTTISPISSPAPNEQARWTFVVVRHANRADDGTDDPPLTEAGEIRARRLADLIFNYPGVATYATRFRRAQDTARPTAVLWDVPVTTYDVRLTPAELVKKIKQQHPKGAILIVGHSDTVPGIAAELCRCPIDPIQETDYANRYEVALRSDSSVLRVDHQTSY